MATGILAACIYAFFLFLSRSLAWSSSPWNYPELLLPRPTLSSPRVLLRQFSYVSMLYLPIRGKGEGVALSVQLHERRKLTFTAEKLLVSTGRRPNTQALGLQGAGVEVDAQGAVRGSHPANLRAAYLGRWRREQQNQAVASTTLPLDSPPGGRVYTPCVGRDGS